MGLRLIIGPSASGKTTMAAEEIAGMIRRDPHRRIIYIVPEQMTLNMERRLMQCLATQSLIGPSVYGFKRLAYRIFEETGMPDVLWLDDVGKSMILQRVAIEHQKELKYFSRNVHQSGFIDRMKMMVTEMIQYRLDEEQLRTMILKQPENGILRAKLEDISLLWHYFNAYLEKEQGNGKLKASETLLDELAPVISSSETVRRSEIYIDGYTGFTPQQYRIIEELLKTAPRVSVCLTMTEKAFREAESIRDWRDLPRRLYFTAQKTASKLSDVSASLGTARSVVFCREDGRAPEIRHALQTFCSGQTSMWEGPVEHVHRTLAGTKEEEVQSVMHRILDLVRENHYEYRDIALVCTNLPGYSHLLKRMSALYRIPLFMDEKSEIRLHPLVQWMQASCGLITGGFSLNAFTSWMKTGLCGIPRDLEDRIENTAMQENWIGKERILSALHDLAPETEAQLRAFDEAVRDGRSADDYSRALLQLAEDERIPETLEREADQLNAEGELLMGLQYLRIFGEISRMMEQLDRILQGVSLSFDEYQSMLRMGIAECRMGQLPSKIDEVSVGDLERSRIGSCKAVFFLGMQGDAFPAVHSGGSLLTDTERTMIGNMPEMAQGERESLMEQYYLLQIAMGKASEHLCFFSHRLDEKGEELTESSFWRRMAKCFPEEKMEFSADAAVTLPLPMLYEKGDPDLLEDILREDKTEKSVSDREEGEETFRHGLDMARAGRCPEEDAAQLSPELASALIDPSRRLLSVSQLECYAECPYHYYLQYGLMLKERETPDIREWQEGIVLHDLLREAGEYLDKVLSREEAQKITESILEGRKEEYRIYQSTGRFRYYWIKLQKTAAWGLQILSRQYAWSDFEHKAFEWEFSERTGCGRPVEIRLKNGRTLRLQGKIDRVDLWSDEEQQYVQIIDYKTGDEKIEFGKLYHGLQMQLPVYMDAAEENFGGRPAGFFYFHLTPSDSDGSSGDVEEKIMKDNRLNGLYVADPALMRHMDTSMEPGTRSCAVLPGGLTKKGQINRNSKNCYATEQQMEDLKSFVREKIGDLAENMMDGVIPRNPIQSGRDIPCRSCAYSKACPYDPGLSGQEKKTCPTMTAEEFFRKIEVGKD